MAAVRPAKSVAAAKAAEEEARAVRIRRRQHRLLLLCLLSILAVFWVAATRGRATEDGLTLQVTRYYAALDQQRYGAIYGMLTPRRQQEQPRKEFADRLRAADTRLEFKGSVTVTMREGEGVAIATVRAPVAVRSEGGSRDGVHETQWVWSQTPDSPEYRWLLLRDTLQPPRQPD